MQTALSGLTPATVAQPAFVADIGQPRPEHLQYATGLHEALPDSLQSAARDPLGAMALVCAFLLDDDQSLRDQQLAELARISSEGVREETVRIWPATQGMPGQAKIPLIDMALPALRRFSLPQFEQFRAAVNALIESDNQVTLFEFMLQKMVMRHLETRFYPERRPLTQFYDLRPLANDGAVLLSALAYAGAENETAARAAFDQGAESLGRAARTEIPWLPPNQCELSQLNAALDRFDQSVPQIKKNVLTACSHTVAFDGVIQPREAELLRAIADALDCPAPPFLSTPRGA